MADVGISKSGEKLDPVKQNVEFEELQCTWKILSFNQTCAENYIEQLAKVVFQDKPEDIHHENLKHLCATTKNFLRKIVTEDEENKFQKICNITTKTENSINS